MREITKEKLQQSNGKMESDDPCTTIKDLLLSTCLSFSKKTKRWSRPSLTFKALIDFIEWFKKFHWLIIFVECIGRLDCILWTLFSERRNRWTTIHLLCFWRQLDRKKCYTSKIGTVNRIYLLLCMQFRCSLFHVLSVWPLADQFESL